MSIKDDIAELEAQIAELRKQEEQGFSFLEIACGDSYGIRDDHELVYDLEDNLAGIVVNVAVMQKYMESLK